MKWPFAKGTLPAPKQSKYRAEHVIIDCYLAAVTKKTSTPWFYMAVDQLEDAHEFLLRGRPAGRLASAIAERLFVSGSSRMDNLDAYSSERWLGRLSGELMDRRPEFEDQELLLIVKMTQKRPEMRIAFGRHFLARMLLRHGARVGVSKATADALRIVIDMHERLGRGDAIDAEDKRHLVKMRHLLSGAALNLPPQIEPWQAPFADSCVQDLSAHAWSASSTRPTKKWLATSETILAAQNDDDLLDRFERCISALRSQQTQVDSLISDQLRGLCWLVGLISSPRVPALLGQMLLACNHKLSGFGARAQKGFSACVYALEALGTVEALAEFSKAKTHVKTPSLAGNLIGTLERAASERGVELAELEELVVPTFDLDPEGVKRFWFGDVSAALAVAASGVRVQWFRGEKPLRIKPEISPEHKTAALAVTRLKKDIESSLSAQRQRIESLYLIDRSWPYPIWRQRFLDHPLLSALARRLIWRLTGPTMDSLAIGTDGYLVDIEGRPVPQLADETMVRLWHPLDMGASAVEAWREYLVTNEIVQPFKQAHREVYILTEAERQTRSYSNRFAAHVLRQHQCSALMRGRGWRYQLQGYFDSQSTPTLDLPGREMAVQYFLDVPEQPADPMAAIMTDAGIATYVLTDQVRFVDPLGRPIDLELIPPRVFSEAMRDVDLFVGVASVGNDPAWQDQGERLGYGAYWREYAFGDLSATAETRKAVLERLLPRLSIAAVSRIDGKFLVVAGKLRTYKIHLGSGSIQMSPLNQYLCIVPGRQRDEGVKGVYLPFEGDGVLAIILSKALMLAHDNAIQDPTIVQQIRG
jgi:hypothetical protein